MTLGRNDGSERKKAPVSNARFADVGTGARGSRGSTLLDFTTTIRRKILFFPWHVSLERRVRRSVRPGLHPPRLASLPTEPVTFSFIENDSIM
ncbi:hypothetical protein ACFPVX_20380 [Cohnella faecalis]|uniref:Uncharacterized protein n=1 Tax=Cohnella faecalis TaxID=2315694 RepID=A0A398CYB2_9BACL|nr:hypothetical protein [Cohnella faecalis]RIE00622.1 hypothetical protein D3H35_27425 [Cohnella faecalis]RIE04211.1 hypothetical protein D3H35_06220 [Cohnella faecalis]